MADENKTQREVGPLELAFRNRDWGTIQPDEHSFLTDLVRVVDEHGRELRVCKAEWTALYQRVARLDADRTDRTHDEHERRIAQVEGNLMAIASTAAHTATVAILADRVARLED